MWAYALRDVDCISMSVCVCTCMCMYVCAHVCACALMSVCMLSAPSGWWRFLGSEIKTGQGLGETRPCGAATSGSSYHPSQPTEPVSQAWQPFLQP